MDAIFKQYPKLEEYFVTSDGQKFFHEGDAKNHARKFGKQGCKGLSKDT